MNDAVSKNESLLEIVRRRDDELRDAINKQKELKEQRELARGRVLELEDRIKNYAKKNLELDEIINEKLVERAERYKAQVSGFLQKSNS